LNTHYGIQYCTHIEGNLICICWPEDGRSAVETCSQKLLNVLALTIVHFIILLLCLTWNIYTCIVTQRDGFRQIKINISGLLGTNKFYVVPFVNW